MFVDTSHYQQCTHTCLIKNEHTEQKQLQMFVDTSCHQHGTHTCLIKNEHTEQK